MTYRVLMYSGGMDSYALRQVWQPHACVYVDMGSPYSRVEISRLDPLVEVLRLPLLHRWERDDSIIPLRNLFLAAVGAQYGGNWGHVQVALAATAGDRTLDKSYEFASKATDLMSYAWQEQWWTPGKTVEVVLPAKHLTKRGLVREYLASGGSGTDLARESYSCYAGTPVPCGVCKPCTRRWVALAANGIESDPDCYDVVAEQFLEGYYNDRGDEKDDVAAAIEWRESQ